jgi:hypothetical protein
MSGAADMASVGTPGQISFADIERDMEKGSFGCANGAGGCHGGTMPTGVMKLAMNASQDMTALMGNFMQVTAMMRVTPATPDQSLLLLKTLMTSTTSHLGIKPFANAQDPSYQRWLLWIQLGANFQPVPTTGLVDM